jgi:hypothetical protein
MSHTALRNVNAVPLTERRSNGAKKRVMKVVLSGPNDENLDLHRRADDYFQPTLAPRPAIVSNVEMEVPTEPGPAELEYIVSDDLKDLADVDTQVMVNYLALLFSISTLVKAGQMQQFYASVVQSAMERSALLSCHLKEKEKVQWFP